MILMERPVWWDGSFWFRTRAVGGYNGYRTLLGRRLPCSTLETARRCPERREEIRRVAAPVAALRRRRSCGRHGHPVKRGAPSCKCGMRLAPV